MGLTLSHHKDEMPEPCNLDFLSMIEFLYEKAKKNEGFFARSKPLILSELQIMLVNKQTNTKRNCSEDKKD